MDCFHSHTGHPSSCAEGSAIFRPFSRTGYWTVCLKHQCLWWPRKEKIALKAPSRNTLYLPPFICFSKTSHMAASSLEESEV